MKPYYQTENGVLYNGDCLEVMKGLEPDSVDLVLTDPPYGIDEANGKNKSRSCIAKSKDYGNLSWDNSIPEKEIFQLLLTTKNQIIFGGNYFIEHLKNSPCWLVWDKLNGNNDFADCELAWASFKTAVRKYEWRWQGMLQQQMGQHKEERHHPTQKPIGLFYKILEDYSKDTDLILDPFLGSGTTAIVCERLGRKWIGVEINKEYCDIAVKRIEAERAQRKLF